MDGTNVNNPARVPSTLSVIDGPQEGAPRVIHPVSLRVGTWEGQDMSLVTSSDESVWFEVPEEGTYLRDDGSPLYFQKGHRLPPDEAARFAAFRPIDVPTTDVRTAADRGSVATATVNVTGLDEVKDLVEQLKAVTAERDALLAEKQSDAEAQPVELPPVSGGDDEGEKEAAEERAEPTPENRMEDAPENRVEPAPSNRKTRK